MKQITLTALRKLETESKRVTKACRAKMAAHAKKKTRTYSTKATKIAKAIERTGFCGDYKRGAIMIVEAVIGTALPPSTSGKGEKLSSFYVKHAIVVCTSNPNGHDYGRKPALLRARTRIGALRMNGTIGNWMPELFTNRCSVRYATDKEVVAFFKAIRQRIKDKKRVDYFK